MVIWCYELGSKQYLEPMTNVHRFSFHGKPDRPNCGGLYLWAIKGCREYFSRDVITAVDISMDEALATCPIPPPVASATETRFLCLLGLVGGKRIAVQETGLAGVAFFGHDDCDAHQRRFVLEHLDEARMGDLDKRLIVALAHLDCLLPEGVFSDNEGADAFSHEPVNNGSGSHMQVVMDTTVALVGERFHAARGEAVLFGKLLLQVLTLLVIPLVD